VCFAYADGENHLPDKKGLGQTPFAGGDVPVEGQHIMPWIAPTSLFLKSQLS
jgi:hypothetical protein